MDAGGKRKKSLDTNKRFMIDLLFRAQIIEYRSININLINHREPI